MDRIYFGSDIETLESLVEEGVDLPEIAAELTHRKTRRSRRLADALSSGADEESMADLARASDPDTPCVLSQHWVHRTRKESTCGSCGGEIAPGEEARDTRMRVGGALESLRECSSCASGAAHESCSNRGEYRAEF